MVKCLKCRKDVKRGKSNSIYCSENCKTACRKRKYLKYRKDFCEFCGFIPVNICQLDVDHKDGNHNNNDKDNLQTLCANCHRLKTFLNKDNIN